MLGSIVDIKCERCYENPCSCKTKIVFGTYTLAELDAAFEKIRNPRDWKAPIDCRIPVANLGAAQAACVYYTATELSEAIGGKSHDGTVRVVADGYRMGPAGP